MIRGYTDVVADLFHWGHVEFFRLARDLGDVLVVGVDDDQTVAAYTRRPILTFEERLCVVAGCRWVDEVVPAAPLVGDAALLDRHRIDIVVHADDISDDVVGQWYAEPVARGIYRSVPYTAGISTTEIYRSFVYGPDRTSQAMLVCELPYQARVAFSFLGRTWRKVADHEAERVPWSRGRDRWGPPR